MSLFVFAGSFFCGTDERLQPYSAYPTAKEWKAAGPEVKERYNREAADMNVSVIAQPERRRQKVPFPRTEVPFPFYQTQYLSAFPIVFISDIFWCIHGCYWFIDHGLIRFIIIDNSDILGFVVILSRIHPRFLRVCGHLFPKKPIVHFELIPPTCSTDSYRNFILTPISNR